MAGRQTRYCSKRCQRREAARLFRLRYPGVADNRIRALRANGYSEIENQRARERAAERDRQRLMAHPNCSICGERLTVVQRRRGVTCGGDCATYRWRWYVRAA